MATGFFTAHLTAHLIAHLTPNLRRLRSEWQIATFVITHLTELLLLVFVSLRCWWVLASDLHFFCIIYRVLLFRELANPEFHESGISVDKPFRNGVDLFPRALVYIHGNEAPLCQVLHSFPETVPCFAQGIAFPVAVWCIIPFCRCCFGGSLHLFLFLGARPGSPILSGFAGLFASLHLISENKPCF